MKSLEVYKDCLKSKQMFESAVNKNNLTEARILWFSTLTLLRSIGQVLNIVDAENKSDHFKQEVQTRWSEWKSNKIFGEFIKNERDAILKEYEFCLEEKNNSVTHNVTFRGKQVTHNNENVVHTVTVSELIKYKGSFAGESPVDILDNALQWWHSELIELEKIA